MKAIRFVDNLSLALAVIWFAWLPMICAYDVFISHLSAHSAWYLMISWFVLGIVVLILQVFIQDWLYKRHRKKEEDRFYDLLYEHQNNY